VDDHHQLVELIDAAEQQVLHASSGSWLRSAAIEAKSRRLCSGQTSLSRTRTRDQWFPALRIERCGRISSRFAGSRRIAASSPGSVLPDHDLVDHA